MQKLIITAITCLSLCFVFGLNAQNETHPVGKHRLDYFQQKLNLSDAQTKKAQRLMEDKQEKMIALRKDESLDKTLKMEKIKETQMQFQKDFTSMLDEKQQADYEHILSKGKEMRSKRSSGPMAGQRPRKDAMKKRAQHKREKIEPELRAMRKTFDKEISRKDRKKIDQLRSSFEAQKKVMEMKKEELRGDNEMSREAKVEALKAARKDQTKEREELKKLAEKYKDEISAAFEANPKLLERAKSKADQSNRLPRKRKESSMKAKMATRFLLMDPEK